MKVTMGFFTRRQEIKAWGGDYVILSSQLTSWSGSSLGPPSSSLPHPYRGPPQCKAFNDING